MGKTKPRGFCPAECIGAAIGAIAAQINQGADTMAPHCQPQLPGQGVVAPVKPPRRHHAPIAPAKAENGMVNEKRIAPGGSGGHRRLFQPGA
jgi:hypothetical protein